MKRRPFLPLLFVAAVALLTPAWLRGDEAAALTNPRVFVCAHSFMIFTARMLPSIARGAGIPYSAAGQQMIGGSRVLQHWNLPDERNQAKAALRDGKVDVLTVSPTYLIPDDGIDNFTKLGLEKNPKLRVLVQASWPPRDGQLTSPFQPEMRDTATAESLQKIRETFSGTWIKPLEEQVRKLNASLGREVVHIIPAGDAVFALRQKVVAGQAPGVTKQSALFRDALGHPQPPLATLVTYCHFAAIYGKSPVGLPVPESLQGVPEATKLNTLLQEIAWETVSKYPLSGVRAATAGR
jgi:hypothetical protein